MSIVFFSLSAASLIYFIAILCYSGIGTSFCGVWVFISAVFLVTGLFIREDKKNRGEMPKLLPVFIYTTVGLGFAVLLCIMALVMKESKKQYEGDLDYCIVLGAKVYSNGVTKSLKYRLDRGIEYYKNHENTIFVLSGGLGKGDAVPEALAMYNYMVLHGVPGRNLLIEMDSKSTFENIAFSKALIEADWAMRDKPIGPGDIRPPHLDGEPKIGIVTSDYHLMRAVHIAEHRKLENVYSLAAESDSFLYVHQCVRESAAIIKDYLMGNFVLNERDLSIN